MESGGDEEGIGKGGEGVGHAGVGRPLLGVSQVLGHGDGERFAIADGKGEEGGEDEQEEERTAGVGGGGRAVAVVEGKAVAPNGT